MSHLMTCGDAPNCCTRTDLPMQPLPVTTVPNTGKNLYDSNYRGLDGEEAETTKVVILESLSYCTSILLSLILNSILGI